jgi:hypothetical protein
MPTLFVSIPVDDVDNIMEVTDTATAIANRYGGKENGAGFGFGHRDIDWDFPGSIPDDCIEELLKKFPGARVTRPREH